MENSKKDHEFSLSDNKGLFDNLIIIKFQIWLESTKRYHNKIKFSSKNNNKQFLVYKVNLVMAPVYFELREARLVRNAKPSVHLWVAPVVDEAVARVVVLAELLEELTTWVGKGNDSEIVVSVFLVNFFRWSDTKNANIR